MSKPSSSVLLQPSLLDRLIDPVQTTMLFDISPKAGDFAHCGLQRAQLDGALTRLGLTRMPETSPRAEGVASEPLWRYSAPGRTVNLADVAAIRVQARGAEAPAALDSLCNIYARIVPDSSVPAERRAITVRKLRECVLRDLGWLLNAVNLQSSVDLERFPNVASSVLNFGMPSYTGHLRMAQEKNAIAEQLRTCIQTFEPRLSEVVVIPESDGQEDDVFALSFRIEANLWGDPIPQHLTVRTQIDVGTGEIMVEDRGG